MKPNKKAAMILRFFDGDENKATELRGKLTTKNGQGVNMRRRAADGTIIRDHHLAGDKGKPPKKKP